MEILKRGAVVRWKPSVNEGQILGVAVSEDGETARYLVGFIVDGERHQRYFEAGEVEEVKP